ncbi:MAG: hypothetical protein WCP12_02835 [bacterium]
MKQLKTSRSTLLSAGTLSHAYSPLQGRLDTWVKTVICCGGLGLGLIQVSQAGEVLDFAREELVRFAPSLAKQVKLRQDTSLPEFAVAYTRTGKKLVVEGKSEGEILQGVYTVLEKMGYRFEVTGPVSPQALTLNDLPEGRQVIPAAIQRRGVRQHINFNMDVSGYPLSEAQEYIRNLARLRYNWITFHSYPCHWTWDRIKNGALFYDYAVWSQPFKFQPNDLVSGGYFYGGEFKIPNHPLLKSKIRFNKDYFCAPEFEEVIHQHPQRGQRAQQWLRDVMAEARRCGMILTLSTELREIDAAYNLELVNRIVKDYPLLNYVELISQESGDFQKPEQAEPNRAMAREIITAADEAALLVKYPRACKEPLTGQLRNYAINIRTIRQLQQQGWEAAHNVKLICGSYACLSASVKMELELADEFLPKDTLLAIMPGHSSREVFRTVVEADIKGDLFKRLLIHDWIEFDGYMILQQHTAFGIHELANYIRSKTGESSIFGVACNHWRTAPNAVSFRYLGETAMDAKLSPAAFYARYATQLGMAAASASDFASAMGTIDELSDVRAIGGNVGFNLGWDVYQKERSFGMVWWWGSQALKGARDRFDAARKQLQDCRASCSTKSGQATLDQLINGSSCAIEHLQGILELKPFTDKYFDPKSHAVRMDLTADDEKFIADCTNRADKHFQNYLNLLANQVTDRGEEGMLLTYYYAPVVFCNNLRAEFGKQGRFIKRQEEGNVVPQPLTVEDEKRMGK